MKRFSKPWPRLRSLLLLTKAEPFQGDDVLTGNKGHAEIDLSRTSPRYKAQSANMPGVTTSLIQSKCSVPSATIPYHTTSPTLDDRQRRTDTIANTAKYNVSALAPGTIRI